MPSSPFSESLPLNGITSYPPHQEQPCEPRLIPGTDKDPFATHFISFVPPHVKHQMIRCVVLTLHPTPSTVPPRQPPPLPPPPPPPPNKSPQAVETGAKRKKKKKGKERKNRINLITVELRRGKEKGCKCLMCRTKEREVENGAAFSALRKGKREKVISNIC